MRPMRRIDQPPSKSDAVAFLDEEEKLWSWINDRANHSHGQVNTVAGRYRPENWIQKVQKRLDRNAKERIWELMRQRYGNDQCLCSIDPEASRQSEYWSARG